MDLTARHIDLQRIEDDVKTMTEDRAALDRQRKDLDVLFTNPVFDRIALFAQAQKPESMSFPQLKIMIPLGVVLIAGLTGGLVVLREILDQRVRGPADLSTMARIRILGLVSDVQEDPTRPANIFTAFRDAPTGVTAESFRLLRAPVVKAMDQQGHKSLLVLAGMPGSGGTTVATNLGLACAGADERVLIIDANLRRPGIQKAFGLPDGAGLGDVLAGAVKLDDAVRPTSASGLFVLTSGSAANRTMPERARLRVQMARVLTEAKGKFDRIIIDSMPAIVSGDGFALANRVDAVALGRAGPQRWKLRPWVARLRNQLGECRGASSFFGVIIVNAPFVRPPAAICGQHQGHARVPATAARRPDARRAGNLRFPFFAPITWTNLPAQNRTPCTAAGPIGAGVSGARWRASMRCSLITGGSGFIGIASGARCLLDRGDHVTVIDEISPPGRRINLLLAAHERSRASSRPIWPGALNALGPGERFDQIYHLAAAVGVKLVVENPARCIHTNIELTLQTPRARSRPTAPGARAMGKRRVPPPRSSPPPPRSTARRKTSVLRKRT